MVLRPWIDEGHGGADSGAVGGGLKEDDRNLMLGNEIERLFRERGHVVGSSRDTDVFVSLTDRYARANAFGADVLLSIHHDWARGRQAVVYPDSNDRREGTSMRLADAINARIDALAPTQSIIYADRRGLAVLKGTNMPAAIIEAARVQDPYDIKLMALAIVNATLAYFGEPIAEEEQEMSALLTHALVFGTYFRDEDKARLENLGASYKVKTAAKHNAFAFHAEKGDKAESVAQGARKIGCTVGSIPVTEMGYEDLQIFVEGIGFDCDHDAVLDSLASKVMSAYDALPDSYKTDG